jgi:hypothetical protein
VVTNATTWRDALSACLLEDSDSDFNSLVIQWKDSWVEERWERIVGSLGKAVHDVRKEKDLWEFFLDLLALADEACTGFGLPITAATANEPTKYTALYSKADQSLAPVEALGSTLCRVVRRSVARVLPKMHTAQVGLTIRSFSLHLAYIEADEVQPSWYSIPGARGNVVDISRMNVLIVPWPRRINPTQFSNIERLGPAFSNQFEFEIKDTQGGIAIELSLLLDRASERVGQIDAVILPELSLTEDDYLHTRKVALQRGILFIAGVCSKTDNRLNIDVPLSKRHFVHLAQHKHHRWKLQESQIAQYHLGARLKPDVRYWEHIEIQDRKLHFVALRPWMVAAPLICEDLARHDPVAELIKGVGPSLVIAILMDGPQITARWSAR